MEGGLQCHTRNLVLVTAATMIILMSAAVGGGQKEALSALDKCVDDCYPRCSLSRPLWCATLCISKCKNSKSIPDNLCNCTYNCSKFRCSGVGFDDTEKLTKCVKGCSKLCSMKVSSP